MWISLLILYVFLGWETEAMWSKTLNHLKSTMDRQEFELWIDPIIFLQSEEDTWTLAVPNKFYESWISERYLSRLIEAASLAASRDIKLCFKIVDPPHILPESKEAKAAKVVLAPTPATQRPTPASTHELPKEFEEFTFDNFIVGPSNRFAFAAAQGACSYPGTTYNPLFIYGGVGLGKTHLLRAIGNHIHQSYPDKIIRFMTAEEFTNQLIRHLKQKRMDEFQAIYRNCDVLLIDDIQFIARKERTQEEVFHTFNTLYDNKKQIVLTSDQIPKDIPDLEERLRSRFDWGLLADIQPPETETKVAIIEKKAESLNIHIPKEASFFLASVPGPSIRQIEGILVRIGMNASLDNVPITLDLTRRVLKQIQWLNDKPITTEEIIKRVAAYFNVRVTDLKSSQRKKTLTLPRHVAMYLCRRLTSQSYPEIGRAFGGKDHATVMHADRKIKAVIEKDPQMSTTIETLVDMLRS